MKAFPLLGILALTLLMGGCVGHHHPPRHGDDSYGRPVTAGPERSSYERDRQSSSRHSDYGRPSSDRSQDMRGPREDRRRMN